MQQPTNLVGARPAAATRPAGAAPGPRPPVHWAATYPPGLARATEARHAAVAALRAAGLDGPDVDAVETVLGELVANAVRHARTDFTVGVHVNGGVLRAEVTDLDTRPPVVQDPLDDAASGRGLVIVGGLTAAWGWEPAGEGGKRVWAEVALSG